MNSFPEILIVFLQDHRAWAQPYISSNEVYLLTQAWTVWKESSKNDV